MSWWSEDMKNICLCSRQQVGRASLFNDSSKCHFPVIGTGQENFFRYPKCPIHIVVRSKTNIPLPPPPCRKEAALTSHVIWLEKWDTSFTSCHRSRHGKRSNIDEYIDRKAIILTVCSVGCPTSSSGNPTRAYSCWVQDGRADRNMPRIRPHFNSCFCLFVGNTARCRKFE